MTMTREACDNMFLKVSGYNYDNYGLVLGLGIKGMHEEVKWMHHKCLEPRLD